MSAYIYCPGCREETLDVDTHSCDCGYPFPTTSEVMQRLYDSEINSQAICFWDAGWEVKLGDSINGFVAETNVDKLDDAAKWLHEKAHEFFPRSEYAERFPKQRNENG